jgi:hypothetical protein
MGTVQYKAWAIGVGANIYDPAVYIALPILATGVDPGLADPQLYNNAMRQATMLAAALANFISNANGGSDVLDDGNLTNLIADLTLAIENGSVIKPAVTVSASGAFVTDVGDYAVGLNRVAAVADSSTTLPSLTSDDVGRSYRYQDLAGNFNAHPLTVSAPAGHNIAGLAAVVLNQNRQSAEFTYYGSNTWGVKV